MRVEVDGVRALAFNAAPLLKLLSWVIPIGAMAPVPGIVLVNGDPSTLTDEVLREEILHHRQQLECGIAGGVLGLVLAALLAIAGVSPWTVLVLPLGGLVAFYPLYFTLWLVGLAFRRDAGKAYEVNLFEAEAAEHAGTPGYLQARRIFGWARCPPSR